MKNIIYPQMLTKNELKYYSSLLQKKYRNLERKFLVEGERLVEEGLKSDFKCEIVIAANDFSERNQSLKFGKNRFEVISGSDFNKISDTKNPQGIAAVFKKTERKTGYKSDLIAALENISDPGNMGTIIRTCDWFGVNDVILSGDCADLYSPKVLRSTMGSIFHINVNEDEGFYNTLAESKSNGYKILCADMNGEDINEFKSKGKFVVVFCNEANGPTQKLVELIDKRITIPKLGKAESLNVASAAAVVLSRLTR